ncbi:beta-N-acetylhexosaminidase [Sunxiuqinia elliptica]|uniref:beta-N-acetylhexosaminidase n=1 Tax=Sunxiuqinia elliptica TaxID=655355 RepID=A0A1I2KU97_9BACT|nr:beta-N-acetylhexosaminidase [Sunxiuqinia elliptica]SFF68767.1 hexosaminidase [Sunxiuqinia elliptica]
MKTTLFLCFFVLLAYTGSAINIIPFPSKVSEKEGKVLLQNQLTLSYPDELASEGSFLSGILADEFGIKAQKGTESPVISLKKEANLTSQLGQEGYLLNADEDGIIITAATNQGAFYGIQTLRQLIQREGGAKYSVGAVKIEDQPRFSWRAFMLDESRNFKGVAVVKDLLDEMAMLKLNTFHWHLTDDQGWRIEIKKYPLLTEVGARRDSTQTGVWPGGWNSDVYDTTPHEGFYTQEQIRDILAYAQERHITVIPEIEMPGHASAAIAAYPWLGVSKEKIGVPAKFGVHYDVFDFTEPRVEDFLKDVLDEVFQLFPSQVIHIGGDEVKHDHWEASEAVNTFMKDNNLGSYADLQVWFTNRMSNYIESKGRRMMGWNEIMGVQLHEYNTKDQEVKEKLAKNAVIHFWKGDLDLVKQAVVSGHDIVNSYHEYTYLDYNYRKIPLEKAYGFDPIPEGLPANLNDKILGLGCQMWGEWIPTVKSMEELVYPRIAAYAEVGWTQTSQKDFDRFKTSLVPFYNRWTKSGINYIKE